MSIHDHVTVMMKCTKLMLNHRIAIFSDLHIGVHVNSPLWHKIALQWVDWFAASLKQNNIKDVIFCGDFYHNRESIDLTSLQIGADIINKLQEFNLIMIAGNHCSYFKNNAAINSLSIFRGRQNITVVDDKVHEIQIGANCNAVLCPWGTEMNDIPKGDVTFGHFEIQTFKMNTFKMCEQGFSIRKLLEISPLIFSGHFHFRDERLFEIGNIVYVGNPFQTDANDIGNSKGYYIFEGDTKEFTFVENTASPLIQKFKLSALCNEDADLDELYLACCNNIVKFIIDEKIDSEELLILKNKLNTFGALSMEFYDEVPMEESKMSAAFEGIDIEQALIEFIDLMKYPNSGELQQYCLDLYRKCA